MRPQPGIRRSGDGGSAGTLPTRTTSGRFKAVGRIYQTTLSPTKLELLTGWLPSRPWWAGATPRLTKAGGFRLDDPAGQVGLEFFVALDTASGVAVAYLVPLTYRGAPAEGLEHALIGTAEHGVLGTRWVYDGAHDPVLTASLLGLVVGTLPAQAQSLTDTTDDSVATHWPYLPVAAAGSAGVADDEHGTTVRLRTDGPDVLLRLVRRFDVEAPVGADEGYVSATWQLPDGSSTRRHVVLATVDR
jgi:hypothetical protein